MAGEGEVGDEEERGRKRGSAGVPKARRRLLATLRVPFETHGRVPAHQEATVASRWLAADGGRGEEGRERGRRGLRGGWVAHLLELWCLDFGHGGGWFDGVRGGRDRGRGRLERGGGRGRRGGSLLLQPRPTRWARLYSRSPARPHQAASSQPRPPSPRRGAVEPGRFPPPPRSSVRSPQPSPSRAAHGQIKPVQGLAAAYQALSASASCCRRPCPPRSSAPPPLAEPRALPRQALHSLQPRTDPPRVHQRRPRTRPLAPPCRPPTLPRRSSRASLPHRPTRPSRDRRPVASSRLTSSTPSTTTSASAAARRPRRPSRPRRQSPRACRPRRPNRRPRRARATQTPCARLSPGPTSRRSPTTS